MHIRGVFWSARGIFWDSLDMWRADSAAKRLFFQKKPFAGFARVAAEISFRQLHITYSSIDDKVYRVYQVYQPRSSTGSIWDKDRCEWKVLLQFVTVEIPLLRVEKICLRRYRSTEYLTVYTIDVKYSLIPKITPN